jgi:hypothetical protein
MMEETERVYPARQVAAEAHKGYDAMMYYATGGQIPKPEHPDGYHAVYSAQDRDTILAFFAAKK